MISKTVVLLILSVLFSIATYAVAKPVSKSALVEADSESLDKDTF